MDELSMSAYTMDLLNVIAQIESLENHCKTMATSEEPENRRAGECIWVDDVTALQAAAAIVKALQKAGVNDAEQVADLLHDYDLLAKQYQAMHEQYEVPKTATHKDGVWHCPRCHKRVGVNHTHCHWCGQKIKWG